MVSIQTLPATILGVCLAHAQSTSRWHNNCVLLLVLDLACFIDARVGYATIPPRRKSELAA